MLYSLLIRIAHCRTFYGLFLGFMYFCRRERQNVSQLKKTDFSVMTDAKETNISKNKLTNLRKKEGKMKMAWTEVLYARNLWST